VQAIDEVIDNIFSASNYKKERKEHNADGFVSLDMTFSKIGQKLTLSM
jgi:hypothetical protein